MRKKFEDELRMVKMSLTEMGELCEEGISLAVLYIRDDGEARARRIAEIEEETDGMEASIQAQCMTLFMRQQPVAKDLRNVSAALRMISDMERIGDHALDIAEVASGLDRKRIKSTERIGDMAEAATLMVKEAVKSFVEEDLDLAERVKKYDDVVDDYFDEIKADIADDISEKRETAEQGLNMLMIAKYLERVGDHAVNIAEWVKFAITGERY